MVRVLVRISRMSAGFLNAMSVSADYISIKRSGKVKVTTMQFLSTCSLEAGRAVVSHDAKQ
jgi:hypothetical protein